MQPEKFRRMNNIPVPLLSPLKGAAIRLSKRTRYLIITACYPSLQAVGRQAFISTTCLPGAKCYKTVALIPVAAIISIIPCLF